MASSRREATGSKDPELLLALAAAMLDASLPVSDAHTWSWRLADRFYPGEHLELALLPDTIFIGTADRTLMAAAAPDSLSQAQAARVCRLVRGIYDGRLDIRQSPLVLEGIRSASAGAATLRFAAGGALVAAGLALVFSCPWFSVALSALLGAAVGAIAKYMGRLEPAAAIVPFITALLSTLAVGFSAKLLGIAQVPLFALCAPIAILVPGALITNALLELSTRHMVSGASRLMHGILVMGLMIAGLMAGMTLTGLQLDPGSAALVTDVPRGFGGGSGFSALPAPAFAWAGILLLAGGISLALAASWRLGIANTVMMLCCYLILSLLGPLLGTAPSTAAAAIVLFIAARLCERADPSLSAPAVFQPAFLLLVPGTVGLVAAAGHSGADAADAVMGFVGLCLGVKIGALFIDSTWSDLSQPARPTERNHQ
ncbi:hypothetical protein AUR04nite_16840 [Glutamicibacter uratoxydans]|uniref:Threonine/serine exporter-like N-terminal domain-containing protein n=1 Tax=Glutamicibacter uratoxydans TaxID=43667 RepID=A0A4Y4DLF5_GLUUR|nr:threonine/serine exporter family protein [Glutamicibacter uratoxydans]GED06152.1 hypothetical protein AUR04nite_16840 [Glutamicibacter uratoxydans]